MLSKGSALSTHADFACMSDWPGDVLVCRRMANPRALCNALQGKPQQRVNADLCGDPQLIGALLALPMSGEPGGSQISAGVGRDPGEIRPRQAVRSHRSLALRGSRA